MSHQMGYPWSLSVTPIVSLFVQGKSLKRMLGVTREQAASLPARPCVNWVAFNLRRLRHAKGISQDGLAYEAGINRSYMSKLEKGASYPGLEIIAKLAAVPEVRAGRAAEGAIRTEMLTGRVEGVARGTHDASVHHRR
jgi:DNA-binding XRE family transcriptional regulator